MRRFRFSICGIIGTITMLALFLGALVNANGTIAIIVRTATCTLLVAGAAYIPVAKRARRVAVTSFVLCAWTLLGFQCELCLMESDVHVLVTTKCLHVIWECVKVEAQENLPGTTLLVNSGPYPDWENFYDIGILLLAILFGASGALFCRVIGRSTPDEGDDMRRSSRAQLLSGIRTHYRSSIVVVSCISAVLIFFLSLWGNANEFTWPLARSGMCFLMLVTGVCAVTLEGRARAISLAFFLSVWSYLGFQYVVCQSFEENRHTLVSSSLLFCIWEYIKRDCPVLGDGLTMRAVPEWTYFYDTGVLVIAVLLGLTASVVAGLSWRGNNKA